jgi:hypothetical protein
MMMRQRELTRVRWNGGQLPSHEIRRLGSVGLRVCRWSWTQVFRQLMVVLVAEWCAEKETQNDK